MSVMYQEYLNLKQNDSEKLYLFKNGNFYIFIADDALYISKITTLKLSDFSKDIKKCGFPVNSFETYNSIFQNLNLNIEIIENFRSTIHNEKLIMKKLSKLDVDKITPIKAIEILYELKGLANERD